ncbi:hypothetical protein ES332_A10G160300v1 [Gossypium tomentosum]|uniref:Methyltransferase small domain-containing protein n=1 Tax=Gossypium tomentosum TaxID=34277 RepID=A0A5D2NR85_GOSTO|nr:hypothetical protein ES332_A10G160300v1 [Gossypium tomentosum]
MIEEAKACPLYLIEMSISLHWLWRFSHQRQPILVNMLGTMYICKGLMYSREELVLLTLLVSPLLKCYLQNLMVRNGFLKSWNSSFDLVNVLKHEIRDGQLSFRGKRVLELGCGYGVPGIFACLKGACTVHFQDLSAETIRCTTIPNVLANLEQARERQSRQPEGPLTPSRQTLSPTVRFYAGDWEELPTVLSVVRNDVSEVTTGMRLSFSEEDFMDGCSSQDGSSITQEISSRRSRKLSGSRAWERASETDQGESGYDIILMTEIPYSVSSLKKLYALIKKCVRPPYGVVYLSTKKNYVGFNNAARHLRSLVDEEGIFGAHLIKEVTDVDIWKFFLK